jgi:hypothetical protein
MAKFHYFYQSKENKNLDGWIVAKSRDDAYAQLRKQSIKPYKVVGKDPIAWKRWSAIAVLTVALAGTYAWLALRPEPAELDEQFVRHQIYGAESVIRNGMSTEWSACGLDEGERYLSRYAQPGIKVAYRHRTPETASAVEASLARHLEVEDSELLEYRQLKQIVESIKDELRAYIKSGGNVDGFLDRLQERQDQEVAYYNAANQELENAKATMSEDEVYNLWAAKNAELRAIGLPMLKEPLSD